MVWLASSYPALISKIVDVLVFEASTELKRKHAIRLTKLASYDSFTSGVFSL